MFYQSGASRAPSPIIMKLLPFRSSWGRPSSLPPPWCGAWSEVSKFQANHSEEFVQRHQDPKDDSDWKRIDFKNAWAVVSMFRCDPEKTGNLIWWHSDRVGRAGCEGQPFGSWSELAAGWEQLSRNSEMGKASDTKSLATEQRLQKCRNESSLCYLHWRASCYKTIIAFWTFAHAFCVVMVPEIHRMDT